MLLTHASHHSWNKVIKDNCLKNYGKNDRKRLTKSLPLISSLGISHEFKKADDSFFEWFVPKYSETISQKNNPLVFDVRGTTINKVGKKALYRTLTIWQNDTIVGGCIFSCWKERYAIAYRIFDKDWPNKEVPAGPALYGEYLMDELSKSRHKIKLTHGLDRNPYGINSSIGLAIFKLSTGCSAQLRDNHLEKFEIDTDKLNTDTLILHYPETGTQITEATLVSTEENLVKYSQLFTYADRLKVNTVLR